MTESPRDPLIFVHIPKTAGSSLRAAVIERLGEGAVAKDYGPDSDRTSPFIRELLYEKPDLTALADELRTRAMLFGHFSATKYLPLLPNARLATFVRDPLRRAESEFVVHATERGYEHGFGEFLARGEIRNKQTFYTRPLSPRHFDFVGRTESYEDDLFRFGRWFGERFPMRRVNVRNAPPPSAYDQGLLERFARLHAEDVAFDYVLTRMRAFGVGPTTVRPPGYGRWARMRDGSIRGFAFALTSHEPVTLALDVDGETRATLAASESNPELVSRQMRIVPEGRFTIAREQALALTAEGALTIRIADTGVVLRESLATDLFP